MHTNLPVNAIVKIPHLQPGPGPGPGPGKVLAPSADNQTRNCDTECSNHHPSLLTLMSKQR